MPVWSIRQWVLALAYQNIRTSADKRNVKSLNYRRLLGSTEAFKNYSIFASALKLLTFFVDNVLLSYLLNNFWHKITNAKDFCELLNSILFSR